MKLMNMLALDVSNIAIVVKLHHTSQSVCVCLKKYIIVLAHLLVIQVSVFWFFNLILLHAVQIIPHPRN